MFLIHGDGPRALHHVLSLHGAVVLFAGGAHTTFSSTATGLIPRCTRLLSQICFNATDSHRTPDAYTAPQERWYFISSQLFNLNQKIDLNLVTLLLFSS